MPNQLAHRTKTGINVSLHQESGLGPADLVDVIDEEEGGCVAAGTVTVPEMNGDLLSAALIWACAYLIVNFSVFLMKQSTPPP